MMTLFGLGLRTSYANKVYEKQKNNKGFAWYWLKVFKIERNKTNCIKFIKFTSILAIVLINLMIFLPLIVRVFA